MRWDSSTYDDDLELTQYIWHNFARLLTSEEVAAARAVVAEEKAAIVSESIAQRLRDRLGTPNDPQVSEMLKQGVAAFRRKVRDRIISQYADEVLINRCDRCTRIVATPAAKQCLWCGYDWHEPPAH